MILNFNFQYNTNVCVERERPREEKRERSLFRDNLDYTIGVYQWDKFWLEESLFYIFKLIAMIYSPNMLIFVLPEVI